MYIDVYRMIRISTVSTSLPGGFGSFGSVRTRTAVSRWMVGSEPLLHQTPRDLRHFRWFDSPTRCKAPEEGT